MKRLGQVKEVFLPTGEELTNIGFKIQIDNELITIVEPQTVENARIYRKDMIYLEEVIVNNNLQYKIISKYEVINND